MGRKKSQKREQKKKVSRYTASTADKYELYQISVQSPEPDIEFLIDTYTSRNRRAPRHLREDFCGTALLTATWIKQNAKNSGEGFDIDPEPLAWGRNHHFSEMGSSANRAILHQEDVRAPSRTAPDIRCAQNFSCWIFKTRTEMKQYFQCCIDDLAKNGMFVMDIHGGAEVFEEMEEETEQEEGFTYVWDQDEFLPVTGETMCYIHFRFPDGTEMNNAFSYHWRVWSIPELSDILSEVGFRKIEIYWEGTDEDDEESGNGIFTRTEKGENDLSWVSYIVATK